MDAEIAKFLAIISGVLGAIGLVWKLLLQMRKDIETPWIERYQKKDEELRECLQARADDAMTQAWNGDDRRHEAASFQRKDKP